MVINFLNGHQHGRKKTNVNELTVWQHLIAFRNKKKWCTLMILKALDFNNENTDINDTITASHRFRNAGLY